MSKRNKDQLNLFSRLNVFRNTKQETLQTILAIIFLALALFFILAPFEKSGVVGARVYIFLKYLFGIGYLLVPLFLIILSIAFFKNLKKEFHISKIGGALLSFLSGLGLVDIAVDSEAGVVGHYISSPLLRFFDIYISIIFLIALLVATLLFLFDAHFSLQQLLLWKKWKKKDINKEVDVKITSDAADVSKIKNKDNEDASGQTEGDSLAEKIILAKTQTSGKAKKEGEESDLPFPAPQPYHSQTYIPIPISLLEGDRGKPGVGDIKANANIIKRTLQNFGVNVEMDEVSIGPSVTRYALKPAEGVKLSRIVGLQNDLALALAAHPIRIEAPIPGKSLVGIEIPNTTKTTVGLASLLSSSEFRESQKPLLLSLGRGVSGKSHYANLAKMPHLLIAGATGAGKSVTIHSIITSLLYRNSPENLKFMMIDPKRVELTLYNKIPHLLTPVITDPKKAILSLKWAAKEMDRRYDVLETEAVRDIESYHKNILEPELRKLGGKSTTEQQNMKVPELMPYIVIVIDELADIMATYPRELEAAIVRLAQMSRAVGIHLMLSTQRPSVNVITGLIKANISSRIALQVTSQIDSRTILDTGGAEKLLGAGDMLFLSGEMSKPQRIQSAFISENELKKVVKFLADNYANELPSEINLTSPDKNFIFESTVSDDASLEDDDILYEEAKQTVVEAGKASTSYIQRKLRVGYARAARLMDLLEERGVIGPADGAKPRSITGVETNTGEGAEQI